MFFAAFVQIMDSFLSIKDQKMTRRAEVVKLILDHSFPNKKAGQPSESSLERYYTGRRDKDTGEIVGDHICHLVSQIAEDYEEALFSDFLFAQSFRKEKISKLCKAFSNEIPDLDANNYATKIAELLGVVYKATAGISSFSPITGSTTQSLHKILDVDRNLISRIIIELIQSLDELIAWSDSADANRIYFTFPQSSTITVRYESEPGIVDKVFGKDQSMNAQVELSPELKELYTDFTRKKRKLDSYCKRYPDDDMLKNLFQKGSAIEAKHFVNSEENTAMQKEIDQYRTLLKQCYCEISPK